MARTSRLLVVLALLSCVPDALAGVSEHDQGLTAGRDLEDVAAAAGALWFTEHRDPGFVGRLSGGQITEYETPRSNDRPRGIALGPDGRVWFAESAGGNGAIGALDPADPSEIVEYTTGLSNGAAPWDVAAGPGGVWFTESGAHRIRRITTAGVMDLDVALPAGAIDPRGIALGPDGNMWFTYRGPNDGGVGRVTPLGAVELHPLPGPVGNPESIAAGADGELWFTLAADPGQVGRIDPVTRDIDLFAPAAGTWRRPYGIAGGRDGATWFTVEGDPAIVVRTVATGTGDDDVSFTTFESGITQGSRPHGIGLGPDGNMWFAESAGAGRLGRITTAPGASVEPASGVTHEVATLQGSVAPNAQATQFRFEWGAGGAFDQASPWAPAGSGTDPVAVSLPVAGLAPETGYAYRVVAQNDSGTTTSAAAQFTAGAAPTVAPAVPSPALDVDEPVHVPPVGVPSPVLGASMVVEPEGEVRVRRPGEEAFSTLSAGANLPVGSVLDAAQGSVALTTAVDDAGTTQTATFHGGRFQVRQLPVAGAMTDVHLRGSLSGCRRKGATAAAGAKRKRPRKRRLWGEDSGGDYRTHGRESVATVRGTRWLTVDRCDGTLTRVTEGAVEVRERRSGRSVLVTAGRRHLARR